MMTREFLGCLILSSPQRIKSGAPRRHGTNIRKRNRSKQERNDMQNIQFERSTYCVFEKFQVDVWWHERGDYQWSFWGGVDHAHRSRPTRKKLNSFILIPKMKHKHYFFIFCYPQIFTATVIWGLIFFLRFSILFWIHFFCFGLFESWYFWNINILFKIMSTF